MTVVDLFGPAPAGFLAPSAVCHVAERLAVAQRASTNSIILGRTVARFGQWLFRQSLKPGYETFLTPSRGLPSHSLGILAESLPNLSTLIQEFSNNAEAPDRRDEVVAAMAGLRTLSFDVAPRAWLVFTGTLEIFECESTDVVAEVDAAVALFFPAHVNWLLFEVKESKVKGAAKQLSNLAGLLSVPTGSVMQQRVSGTPIARVEARWAPEPLVRS
jgi:hypothetical protein